MATRTRPARRKRRYLTPRQEELIEEADLIKLDAVEIKGVCERMVLRCQALIQRTEAFLEERGAG